MMKKPYDLGAMKPETHPIAFLLILCDELQEWNREAYGIKISYGCFAAEADVTINLERLAVTFITHNGSLPETFAQEKTDLLQILDLNELFGSVDIQCKAVKTQVLPVVHSHVEPRSIRGFGETYGQFMRCTTKSSWNATLTSL